MVQLDNRLQGYQIALYLQINNNSQINTFSARQHTYQNFDLLAPFLFSFKTEQWPDFGCEGIKVQRAHQPTSQCYGKSKLFYFYGCFFLGILFYIEYLKVVKQSTDLLLYYKQMYIKFYRKLFCVYKLFFQQIIFFVEKLAVVFLRIQFYFQIYSSHSQYKKALIF
eukprot:TRINITY_DN10118_c0_g1_i1.p1 TRINITY_DN10118_c0_g1~~TRINITY_DN10118_c0_g1_i1.p1  ORF type:complete len:166 (-),score=0.87 TRINITY_DN10118_c0_g1_i1:8-505(-)